MRFFAKFLLVLAAVAWTGTAVAGTIDATVTNAGHIDSETIYLPSDLISVDITITTEVPIVAYGIHVNWSQDLSVVEVIGYPGGHPGVYWQSFGGDGSIDANGAFFNSQDATGVGGMFVTELVGQIVFHVAAADGSADIMAGLLAPDDAVLDLAFLPIAMTDSAVTIHTPEPTTALLLGLGLLGIAYSGRRR